ncbi:MAG TPA: NrsF family protein [Vicinamibacterales bacterium]|jgi:hypothetical protein
MVTEDVAPRALRERIAADIRPVRPLRVPWQRAVSAAPFAALLVVAAPLVLFSVRTDADRVSPFLTWGLSVAQALAGVVLAGAAFRQAVPGRARGVRMLTLLFTVGLAVAASVMLFTWRMEPISLPPQYWRQFTIGCFIFSLVDGLPLLLIFLVFAARGLLTRPAAVGGLAGLAAGVVSDASWRMVCVVTEPSHVFAGHYASLAALSVLGAVLLSVWSRVARAFRRH